MMEFAAPRRSPTFVIIGNVAYRLPVPSDAVLYDRLRYPVPRGSGPKKPNHQIGILLDSNPIRYRAEIGIVPKSPLLYRTNGPIRSIGEMVLVVGRKWQDLVAEIANRVWPSQDRFAFQHPLLHGGFIFGLDATAENRCLGPALECRRIGRQKAGIDQDVVIDPDDIVLSGNIYRSV